MCKIEIQVLELLSHGDIKRLQEKLVIQNLRRGIVQSTCIAMEQDETVIQCVL